MWRCASATCRTAVWSRRGSARSAASCARARAYFAERGTPKIPGDLGAHDCISFEGLAPPDTWTFGPAKPARSSGPPIASVAIRSRLIVNTAEAAIDAAIASVGVTRVLSYQIASAVRAGALVIALRDFEPEPSPVSLVYRGQPLLPLKLRAFLDFATPRLKARLSQEAE